MLRGRFFMKSIARSVMTSVAYRPVYVVSPVGRVEDRVDVGALARQDLPAVEAGGIAAEVPLADHAGVVAALLQQAGDGHARCCRSG